MEPLCIRYSTQEDAGLAQTSPSGMPRQRRAGRHTPVSGFAPPAAEKGKAESRPGSKLSRKCSEKQGLKAEQSATLSRSPNATLRGAANHPPDPKRLAGAAAKNGPPVASSRSSATHTQPLLVHAIPHSDPIDSATCALLANFCSGVTASVSMSGDGPLILATLCSWVRQLGEGALLVQIETRLTELCMNDSIRMRVSSAGGVGAVLHVLAEMRSAVVLCAACRLAKVLAKSEANRDAIAAAVPRLMALLAEAVRTSEHELQPEILALLKTLIKSDSALTSAVALGVERLCVRQIQPSQPHATRAAAAALFARLCGARAVSLEHALPLIEPIVLACAVSSDASFLRASLLALAQLAEHAEVRRVLTESRGIVTLCALAQRTSPPVRVRKRDLGFSRQRATCVDLSGPSPLAAFGRTSAGCAVLRVGCAVRALGDAPDSSQRWRDRSRATIMRRCERARCEV